MKKILVFTIFLIFPATVGATNLTKEMCNDAADYGYEDSYYQGSNAVYQKASDLCKMDLAIQNKDSSICNNIVFNKNQAALSCYIKYAAYYKNPSVCENVQGANSPGSQGISLKYFCYENYAIQANDYPACSKAYSGNIDNCYQTIAVALKNPDVCKFIKDRIAQEGCFGAVASLSTTITVESPNGGESIIIGQKYNINWQSNNISDDLKFYILLIDEDNSCKLFGCGWPQKIADSIQNSGSYIWDTNQKTIHYENSYPAKIKPGKKYKIEVCLAGTTTCGSSKNYFTISDSVGQFNNESQNNSLLISQIQAQIAALMVQVKELQAQQGVTTDWCYTFNNNLGFASSGSLEVVALHKALQKENFCSNSDDISCGTDQGNKYSKDTVSSVIKFQQKYNIVPSSGYVGVKTKAKLNELYSCIINKQ